VLTWSDRTLLVTGCWRNEYALSRDGLVQPRLPNVHAEVLMDGMNVVRSELVEVARRRFPRGIARSRCSTSCRRSGGFSRRRPSATPMRKPRRLRKPANSAECSGARRVKHGDTPLLGGAHRTRYSVALGAACGRAGRAGG
jgi:hypothetical protein